LTAGAFRHIISLYGEMTLPNGRLVMRDLMAVLKALADENRVRALLALGAGELCVCQIVELLGLAPSTVSKHMAILKHARLVESRKQGRWMFYRLAKREASVEAKKIAAVVSQLLADNPQIDADAKRLIQILKIDPEVLCDKHKGLQAGRSLR
jgi:ArsR family transcriptional regulator, arsenate/arsenite/antimonite-responsive transcriptional repressor